MRMPRSAAVALAAIASIAALLAPRAADAAPYGLRLFGGYNTYAMGDWDDVRRSLFLPASLAGDPSDGHSLGVSGEMGLGQSLTLTASYERLVPGRMSEINGQQLQIPANAFLLEAEYRRRWRPRLMVGVGAGLGYYQLGDEVESPPTARNLEGESLGWQAFALGEWEWTSSLALGLDVGYRNAEVGVDEVNRHPPFTDTVMDYSGLHTRLFIRVHEKGAR